MCLLFSRKEGRWRRENSSCKIKYRKSASSSNSGSYPIETRLVYWYMRINASKLVSENYVERDWIQTVFLESERPNREKKIVDVFDPIDLFVSKINIKTTNNISIILLLLLLLPLLSLHLQKYTKNLHTTTTTTTTTITKSWWDEGVS